jgi:helix-turn-helix protein
MKEEEEEEEEEEEISILVAVRSSNFRICYYLVVFVKYTEIYKLYMGES